MTIETTRRRVLSGVAGGAVALTGAAACAQADEDMTPQEEWDVCIQGAVTLMRRAGKILKQYPDCVRDPLADIGGAS